MLDKKVKVLANVLFDSQSAQRLQKALGERESLERQKHDHLVATLSRTLETSLAAKIDRTVKDEIRQHVVPCRLSYTVNNLLFLLYYPLL